VVDGWGGRREGGNGCRHEFQDGGVNVLEGGTGDVSTIKILTYEKGGRGCMIPDSYGGAASGGGTHQKSRIAKKSRRQRYYYRCINQQ